MRLSRGASLDERRPCPDHTRHTNPGEKHSFDNLPTSNTTDRHIIKDSFTLERKKTHSNDRREKSKTDRHSFYSERENGNQLKTIDFIEKLSDSHIKRDRKEVFSDENSGAEALSFYDENGPHTKIVNSFTEHESNVAMVKNDSSSDRRSFFSENELANDNRIRRENLKSKFFETDAEADGRSIYGDLEDDSQVRLSDSSCNFFDKGEPQIKVETEPKLQSRRASHFSECDNRKSFGEAESRRSKGLRQELRSQRSNFSESVDSASSRSQLSSLEPATDFADKMLKSSRSYLTESDCCRLSTTSSAREASDDSSPGAITQGSGFDTLDSKYSRKRARKCGHRRQKSLDIGRSSTKQDLSQSESKSFRDFDLEEDLSKRLDRLEPKSGGFIRHSLKNNLSRYDLNFDSEDERCFRHSLDMDRSFDLDFLDTSIDDRYGSFERDFDLV